MLLRHIQASIVENLCSRAGSACRKTFEIKKQFLYLTFLISENLRPIYMGKCADLSGFDRHTCTLCQIIKGHTIFACVVLTVTVLMRRHY